MTNMDYLDYSLKLFNFRRKNIRYLLDCKCIQKTYEILPAIIIQKDEFNSYKYYILKNLSWNGESIIEIPEAFGFEQKFYPYLRYRQISSWKRFDFLGNYNGDTYKYILKYSQFCEKVAETQNLKQLFSCLPYFDKIHNFESQKKSIVQNLSIKDKTDFFYFYDLYYKDYSKRTIQNLTTKENFCKMYLKNQNIFNTTIGFYKALFIVLQKNSNKRIPNENIIKILIKIQNLEIKGSSNIRKRPYIWPWIYGEYVMKQMGGLNGFRDAME
ncbi:MAG: hypothetical protein V3V33_10220 [Candidatus Lokiarchaeia archaeon]